MALTTLGDQSWREAFKAFGRLTMMRNIIGGDIPVFQSGVVVTAQRLASEDFGLISSMMTTFINNMNTLSSNFASAKTAVNTSLTTYVTSVIKSDINSDATTASGVLNDMFSLMRSSVVAVSGTGLFQTMFGEVFGFLPHFFPRYTGAGGAPLMSPDAGATTIVIRENFATFDWKDWG